MGIAALGLSPSALAQDAAADPVEIDLTGPPAPEPAPEEETSWLEAPSERRCGFTFGLAAGANLGAVSGFPNDAVQIGRSELEVDTGFAGGGSGVAWVGLAPTDWFAFGGEFSYGRLASSNHDTGFGAGSFRIDAFPLFGLGDAWRDVGLNVSAGLAISTTTQRDGGEDPVIDSSLASRFSAGVFYEGIRLWKISMGPAISYDGIWSPSVFQPTVWVGWRTAFYAGP